MRFKLVCGKRFPRTGSAVRQLAEKAVQWQNKYGKVPFIILGTDHAGKLKGVHTSPHISGAGVPPEAILGKFIALNFVVTCPVADQAIGEEFATIIAPSFTRGAIAILTKRNPHCCLMSNVRFFKAGCLEHLCQNQKPASQETADTAA